MSMPRTAPDHTERQAHTSQPAARPERRVALPGSRAGADRPPRREPTGRSATGPALSGESSSMTLATRALALDRPARLTVPAGGLTPRRSPATPASVEEQDCEAAHQLLGRGRLCAAADKTYCVGGSAGVPG